MEIKEICEKLGMSSEEAETELLEIECKLPSSLSAEARKKRAAMLFYKSKREEMLQASRSPAKPMKAIILGSSGEFDIMAGFRAILIKKAEENKQEAAKKGDIELHADGTYTLLDNRKTFTNGANPNYGKPMPVSSPRKTVFGVLSNGDPFMMTLRGEKAKLATPMYCEVSFNGIIRGEKLENGCVQVFDSPSRTKGFKVTGPEIDVEGMVTKHLAKFYVKDPNNIMNVLNKTQEDKNRIAIVKGDVVSFEFRENVSGQMFIDIGTGGDNICCWLSSDCQDAIDFGELSEVYVLGRLRKGRGINPETGEYEEGRTVQINAWMAWATPMYKVDKVEALYE